jgi:maltose operon protein
MEVQYCEANQYFNMFAAEPKVSACLNNTGRLFFIDTLISALMQGIKMKRMLIIALAVILTGCSNNKSMIIDYGKNDTQEIQKVNPAVGYQELEQAILCCDSLSELSYSLISNPGKFDFVITSQNEAFNFTSGKSFVKGIALPTSDSAIKISISSPIVSSVFVPTILILDAQYKPLRLYGEESITYDSGSLLNVDRLFADIELPAVFEDGRHAKYLLILTTESAMQGKTRLALPDASAAEIGREDLIYKLHNNKPLAHTATGIVRLAFDYRPSSKIFAKEIVIKKPISSEKAQSIVPVQKAAESVSAEEVINNAIQPESEAMFIELIEQAVEDGDYKKAMRFVVEAERAGSSKARDALFDAANKQQK